MVDCKYISKQMCEVKIDFNQTELRWSKLWWIESFLEIIIETQLYSESCSWQQRRSHDQSWLISACLKYGQILTPGGKMKHCICINEWSNPIRFHLCFFFYCSTFSERFPSCSSGSLAQTLQEVNVPIVSNTQCNSAYGGITNQMICAGLTIGGKDSCQVKT